ncbi:MAG: TRL-like family protein [Spirochaetota bacterium]
MFQQYLVRLLFLTIGFSLSQCTYGIPQPIGPTHGLLFTTNSFPGEFNPNNDVARSIRAEGCLKQILYIVAWGDASAGSIAKKNGIKRIATIDHRTENVAGMFATYCTVITGEK